MFSQFFFFKHQCSLSTFHIAQIFGFSSLLAIFTQCTSRYHDKHGFLKSSGWVCVCLCTQTALHWSVIPEIHSCLLILLSLPISRPALSNKSVSFCYSSFEKKFCHFFVTIFNFVDILSKMSNNLSNFQKISQFPEIFWSEIFLDLTLL